MPTNWLTPRQAADYAKLSIFTIRRAIKSGALKSYAIATGRHVRLRSVDVDAWLMSAPKEQQP
jgi:excisionase family DNA binding protein